MRAYGGSFHSFSRGKGVAEPLRALLPFLASREESFACFGCWWETRLAWPRPVIQYLDGGGGEARPLAGRVCGGGGCRCMLEAESAVQLLASRAGRDGSEAVTCLCIASFLPLFGLSGLSSVIAPHCTGGFGNRKAPKPPFQWDCVPSGAFQAFARAGLGDGSGEGGDGFLPAEGRGS